ncbi:MAG TPA: DMT family transporter [Candidatus Sulfotelmatobacter sp.]|nr:DMT family transporter [Candidatus Sulfotelmatobacter sp.]
MSHHWGYISVVVAAVLFGVSSTLNKIALKNVNPTVIAGLIYFIAGAILFAIHFSPLCNRILAKLGTSETETKITGKDFMILAFVILSGSIIAPFLLLNGLNQTTAVDSSLLLNAESLFTVALAFIFLNERCAKKEYIGMLLLLAGVIFITTSGAFQNLKLIENLIGNLFVIGACLFWGIDNNLSKFLSNKRDILLVTGLKCFIGGCALLALSFVLGLNFALPLFVVPYILVVGAFSVGFSLLFFLFALRKIGSMRTSVIFSLSSLFGAVLAFIVLGETFTVVQLIGGIVMIFGIYVLYRCTSLPIRS